MNWIMTPAPSCTRAPRARCSERALHYAAIDSQGRLYATCEKGIEVFAADGKHLGMIPTPRRAITLAFSGPERKTLFVPMMAVPALLLWRKRLWDTRWALWLLLLATPFPFIANTAG